MTEDEYGAFAQCYDHVSVYQGRPDVDFYVGLAKETGGPVLELGCGTGRVLVPTAREGIEITGLDRSEGMLGLCQERLGKEPREVQQRVRLESADMRDFKLDRRFRVATMPFRPFQHLLTVDHQLSCLACIREHLQPGGTLALDVFDPSLARLADPRIGEEVTEDPPFRMPNGSTVIRKHRYGGIDYANQIMDVEIPHYVTYPDGRIEQRLWKNPMRYFFRYELEHLIARAGFELEAIYGGFDKSPVGARIPGELIVVARKP